MGFSSAIRKALLQAGDYRGRAGRAEFWWFMLFVVLVAAVLIGVDVAIQGSGYSWGFADVWVVLVLIPLLPLGARRLQDGGRSGWWQLIALVPMFGLLLLILWFSRPGERAANAWGPAGT